jgi:hypothetical protein
MVALTLCLNLNKWKESLQTNLPFNYRNKCIFNVQKEFLSNYVNDFCCCLCLLKWPRSFKIYTVRYYQSCVIFRRRFQECQFSTHISLKNLMHFKDTFF